MPRSSTDPQHLGQQVLSTADVAEVFGRSPRTIRDWVARGLLQPVRVGRSVFIPKVQVDALLTGLPVTEQDPSTAADQAPSQGDTTNSKSIIK
jgi:excisionase family DNA binding protein